MIKDMEVSQFKKYCDKMIVLTQYLLNSRIKQEKSRSNA